MLSIIQFHAGSYQPRSLQVGAGDRSVLRMSSRVDRRAPQRKGLVSEEALFWNCPRTPLKSSPCLHSRVPFGLCSVQETPGLLLFPGSPGPGAALCQQDGLLFRGGCSFPGVRHPPGLSTLPRGSSRTEVKSMRQDWMTCSQEGGGSFSPWATGAGLGEERDLHLISCK